MKYAAKSCKECHSWFQWAKANKCTVSLKLWASMWMQHIKYTTWQLIHQNKFSTWQVHTELRSGKRTLEFEIQNLSDCHRKRSRSTITGLIALSEERTVTNCEKTKTRHKTCLQREGPNSLGVSNTSWGIHYKHFLHAKLLSWLDVVSKKIYIDTKLVQNTDQFSTWVGARWYFKEWQ